MRKTVVAVTFLLFAAAAPLFAIRPTLVDDAIRMHRSGVSDEVIIAFVHRPHDPFEVAADDLIAMKDAGLSRDVIEAVISEATAAAATATTAEPKEETTAVAQTEQRAEEKKEAPAYDGGWCLTFDPPVIFAIPGLYGWWDYPEWVWNPWWYMPTYDAKSGAQVAGGHPKGRTPAATGSTPTGTTVSRERPKAGDSAIASVVRTILAGRSSGGSRPEGGQRPTRESAPRGW